MKIRNMLIGVLTLGISIAAIAQNPPTVTNALTAPAVLDAANSKKEIKGVSNPNGLDALLTLGVIIKEPTAKSVKLNVLLDGKLYQVVEVVRNQPLYLIEVRDSFKTMVVEAEGLVELTYVGMQFVKAYSEGEKINVRGRSILDVLYAHKYVNAKEKVIISDIRTGFLAFEEKLDNKGGFTDRALMELFTLYKLLASKEVEALFSSLQTREGLEVLIVQIRTTREDIRARVREFIDMEEKAAKPPAPTPKVIAEIKTGN